MAFEERLRGALESAAELLNSGSTPDEAACKVASANGFNKDQTDRLVEVLNTAITINQYKYAEDRTKSFPIAHKDRVAAMMMDADKVLGTSEKKAESGHVYFEYMSPAYDYVANFDDTNEKAAESGTDPDANPAHGLSLENLAYLSVRQINMFKDAGAFAKNVAGQMKGDLVTKLYDLADSIRKGGEDRYARFKEACAHKEIVSNLERVLPEKFAEAKCRSGLVDDSDLVYEIKLADDMHETYEFMKEMRKQHEDMQKKADEMSEQMHDAFVGGSDKPGKPGESSFTDLFNWTKTAAAVKPSGGGGLSGIVFGSPQSRSAYKGIINQDAYSDIPGILFEDYTSENDETKRTVENVRRAMMLQELMASDPIISAADPDTVASTYQTILGMSPSVANDKEVVRSILRQAINSVAISPFDANTWADIEKKQRESARA